MAGFLRQCSHSITDIVPCVLILSDASTSPSVLVSCSSVGTSYLLLIIGVIDYWSCILRCCWQTLIITVCRCRQWLRYVERDAVVCGWCFVILVKIISMHGSKRHGLCNVLDWKHSLGAFWRDIGLARTVCPLPDVRRQKTIRDVQYGAVPPGC